MGRRENPLSICSAASDHEGPFYTQFLFPEEHSLSELVNEMERGPLLHIGPGQCSINSETIQQL